MEGCVLLGVLTALAAYFSRRPGGGHCSLARPELVSLCRTADAFILERTNIYSSRLYQNSALIHRSMQRLDPDLTNPVLWGLQSLSASVVLSAVEESVERGCK
jgi:hypothetical protein